ncbi:MAG TPA: hypothetical protein VN873_15900 [Candidatus Angelobacter sp.]|nr:hypothetical protein [Candidatus Angelobacter sp.]
MKPLDKIQIIESSTRCFTCGLIGILPLIGLPFAIIAIANFVRVQLGKGTVWNPANGYLSAGGFCAAIGLGISTLLIGSFIVDVYWRALS